MSRGGERAQQLRVIAGRWRSRRLSFPELPGLRPTPDRVRETLFNWLAPVLPGARCLDLFAGSGALGIEALSRGAAEVVFVERHPVAIRALRENLARLNGAGARIEQAEALAWLRQPGTPVSYTHLDVYKRQTSGRCSPARSRRPNPVSYTHLRIANTRRI